MWRIQMRLKFPGLAQDVKEILCQLGLSDMTSYSKTSWKKILNTRIHEFKYKELMAQRRTYKKLNFDELKTEEYEVKPYIFKLIFMKLE